MSVGLLLITHNNIGQQLLQTAAVMLDATPMPTRVMGITVKSDPDRLTSQALQHVIELDEGDGVLVLTDMYGSTPSNIANRLVSQHKVSVITGLNLPMLIRVLNYPRLDLVQLAEKAISGGRDGVMLCPASYTASQVE